jgi:exopolyphosphatase/guanosine-5'-triphosphate,3'-diphosphate pyrophosphatase
MPEEPSGLLQTPVLSGGRVERVVERQLGRPPRGLASVAALCPHGCPAVVETTPYLEDGTPFPTLFYLTCPSAVARVSTVEEEGGVEQFRAWVRADTGVEGAFRRLTSLYKARRRELYESRRGSAQDGVGEGAEPGAGGFDPEPDGLPRDGLRVLEAGIGGPVEPKRASCLHAYSGAVLAVLGEWGAGRRDGVSPAEEEHWRTFLASLGELWCTEARCRAFEHVAGRRAAIDVGTNSVRLLVADVREVGGRRWPDPVVRRAEVTRLGEGVDSETPALSEVAMARTRAAVDRYVEEARDQGAEHTTLFATSAARRAKNGTEFISSLGRYHRIAAGVLSGELEAALAYSGATLDVPGEAVLLDVGGGSTELVRGVPQGQGLRARSLDLGCVSLTEAFVHEDPPTAGERGRVREQALALLEPLADAFGGAETLVAVAGTATTLACLSLGLSTYDAYVVHLTMLNRGQVTAQLERLASLTLAERAALPCMQTGRADVIVAGAEIILAAMDALGYNLVLVSERDILDGVILATQ